MGPRLVDSLIVYRLVHERRLRSNPPFQPRPDNGRWNVDSVSIDHLVNPLHPEFNDDRIARHGPLVLDGRIEQLAGKAKRPPG